MALVDRLAERDAVENAFENRKNLVDVYRCPECGAAFATVTVHAGAVPFFADCETAGCGGDAVQSTADGRVKADAYEGRIDFEWYRPLSEEECAVAVSLIEAEASSRAENPKIPPGERPYYADLKMREKARHLLSGGLLRRPRHRPG
jgi:hypothetical protein